MNIMSGRTIEIIIDLKNNTNGKLDNLKKQLDSLDKQAQRINNRFKSFATQRYFAFLGLIDRITAPASRVQKILQGIARTTWRVSLTLADGVTAGVRKLEGALNRIAGKVYPVTIALKNGIGNKLNGLLGGALMGAGAYAPIAGMAGIGFGAATAIQSYTNFEYEMSKVRAITRLGKDSKEFQGLLEQAKHLGRTTEWTRTEVAEAMRYAAMAGWKPEQIKNAVPSILNLATAGGTDLGTTSDIMTDAATAFGLRAGEMYTDNFGKQSEVTRRLADVMAATVTNSNTNTYQLGEALKYSAPVVGAMYSDQDVQKRMQGAEDLMILTGLMASGGVKASQAGTSARAVFQRFGAENRNALYGLKFANVDFVDKLTGDVRPIIDIMKDLNRVFKEGVDANELINFAEEIEGVRLHADTRRKIEGLIGNAQAHGGKLGGGDRLKLASMLAGTEAMSGILLGVTGDIEALEKQIRGADGAAEEMAATMRDNLAGSFKLLGSAWDSFQQGLLEGKGGEGIRAFVDTLTEIISRADKLFSDGIHVADFGKIIGDVIGRLKNKFLELDGIGSILAGGALAAGLTKIFMLSQRALGALKNFGKAGVLGTAGAGMAAGAKVGTMTVSAGVVNVNGKVAGGGGGYYGGGGRAGVPSMNVAAPSTAAAVFAAQKQFDKLNSQFITAQAKREAKWGRVGNLLAMNGSDKQLARARTLARNFDEKTFLPLQTRFNAAQQALINARVADYNAQIAQSKQSIALAREQEKLMSTSRWSNFKGAAGGAAIFAGIFSALDVMNVRAANAERLAAATTAEERTLIARENRHAEWQAAGGGLGSVVGAAIGAGLGSFAGPLGTAIGGVVGGMLGDAVGRWFGDKGAERETVKSGTNLDVLDKEIQAHMTPATPPDYSFGQTQTNKTLESFATFDKEAMAWSGATTAAVVKTTQEVKKIEQDLNSETEAWIADFKRQNAMARDFTGQWRENSTTQDYFKQQRDQWAELSKQDYGGQFSAMLENLFSMNKAHAAELTPEQMAQQAAMEQGTFYPTGEMTTPGEPPEVPDMSAFVEQFYSEMEALQEGVGELFNGFGEQITEQLTSTFEGAGEVFSNFGTTITEGLTATFEGAGEMFTGFGEQLTASMTAAQESATVALTTIQTTFTTTKDTVQTSWAELPGFFSGVFSGLGGAAEAAGAAIHAGLTAPIGSIISAWQGAAATISSIISSISAQAAAMPNVPSGGAVAAHADGGFVTSPEVALIGERGAEVVIPLNGSQRALDLYKQTGEVLGISDELGDSAISGSSSGSNNGSGGVSISNVNVNLEISGVENAEDIMQKIREHAQEISDIMAEQLSGAIATIRKNQPLCA